MKLFKLENKGRGGYDTYDSCVVCAESAGDAKSINPDGEVFKAQGAYPYSSWALSLDKINCIEIGEANKKQKRGVICASFNAG